MGGNVNDGVALYNFFRALPVDLTLYNVGSVASAAVIAYLGAKERKVSTYATFMLHRTQSSAQFAFADHLEAITHSLRIDDDRTEAILRQHLTLSDDRWAAHRLSELWLTANDAMQAHLADAIAEFAPPKGMPLFSV